MVRSQKDTSASRTGQQFQGSIGSPENLATGISSPSSNLEQGSREYSTDKGMMTQAREKLLHTAEEQKAVATGFVSDLAGAVRRAAGEFESQIPQAATYIRYAADQLDSMSDAVQQRDMGRLMSDLQSFARRQPTAFLGATFLAGFAAVRFLKSTSNQANQRSAAMRAPSAGTSENVWEQDSMLSGKPAASTDWQSAGLDR